MPLCRFGDVVVESDFPLKMAAAEGVGPDYTLLFPQTQELGSAPAHWFHQFADSNGEPWLSLAKLGSSYLLRYHDLVDFLVSPDGKEIRGHPAPDTESETIRHLFLDQVMPRVLGQQGRRVLHAGAVLAGGGAIAFLGDTGSGKSTLTASFCQQGFPGITDDCLLLTEEEGELFAVPTYTGLRLWPDTISALLGNGTPYPKVAHYTEKRRLSVTAPFPFCADRVPLKRIYVLAPPTANSETVTITPLSARDGLMALVNSAFRLDITDKTRLSQEFEAFVHLSSSVVLHRLTVPRDLKLLPAVREAILKNLAEE